FSVPDKFDIVILKHVLEHIKNPIGLIKNIKKHLNKFGKIIIVVPNRKGYKNEARVYLPEHGKHYFLWDRESLQFTLERLGFTCRFNNLYLPAGNLFEKIFVNLFRVENSDLICVASLDV
ncbi:MAG: methyltransferase domain-containing protein, partial [Patescibacteria group bacterium]|nr:methyltransferase domain-containing protein [Patescibacteria group bacterium]